MGGSLVNLKTELESKKISDNCFLKTYITYDEKTYILEINYRSGRFVAEKQFSNDFNGIAHMEEIKSQYRSEEDVKRHFGII
jgi:hypothetical protein